MAGESPDKVEREESSGETTADGGVVAPTGGKKSRKKRERKAGERPDAAGADPAGAAGEARDEATDDASGTRAEDAASDSGDTEAEAPGTAGGSDAAAGSGADETAESESGSGGAGRSDARLKAAVAAWVAGTGEESGDGSDEADGTGRAGRSAGNGTGKSGAGQKNSSQIPADEVPGRPKSGDDSEASAASAASKGSDGAESSAGPADEVDHPTAMFRTVRPGSEDSADATDSEEAARRAERMTAAFFGSGKPSESEKADGKAEEVEEKTEAAEASEERAEARGADAAADSPGERERSRSAGDDERGAGKAEPEPDAGKPEAGKPGAGKTEPEPEETRDEPDRRKEPAEAGKRSGKAEKAGKADQAGKGADKADEAGRTGKVADRVDQPTTAFRTVQPGAAADRPEGSAEESGSSRGHVDQPTTAIRTAEPRKRAEEGGADGSAGSKTSSDDKKDADAKSAKSAKPVDPRVAPLPKSGSAGKETDAEAEADGGAEAESGTAKPESPSQPGTAPSGKTKPEKPEPDAESDSERTSQFVPLRSADRPPRPTREPGVVVPPKPEGRPTPGALPPEVEQPKLSEAELTRQQVRPDQAPIDLLAQLTNTPPKPETPLRTAVRRVKIWTPLAVLLVILFAIAQAVRPLPEPELSLSASPTYNFQGPKPSVPWPSEGQAALDVQGLGSFGTSGKQKPVPIASVAKVMTAYVILRDHPVKKGSKGAKIPVDKKAEKEAGLSAQNESTVEVKKGDTLSEREAVQAVMIASANNVARLLARWDAGSEKAFAKKMNAAAKDLGMKNTKYTDPSGLTASTVSTAGDQVRLAKKAMGIDLFRETVRMPGYTDTKGDEHGNWNKLVPLDGVVGIKTGTTTKAGGNLLFAAEKKVGGTEQLIVGAVLGQYQPSILDTVLRESHKLIDTAQDSLRAQKVVQKGEVVGYVDDQLGGRTPVVASRDVSAVGWSGLKVKLGLTDSGKALPHEGKAGDRAGTLTIGDGPGQVRVPVTLKDDMREPGFGAKLTRIL